LRAFNASPEPIFESFAASNASNLVSNRPNMKISCDVAQILAAGFLKHGHSVIIGTRSPEKLTAWAQANPAATVGSFADAAAFAEVAVLAGRCVCACVQPPTP
jgi:hypothetical protein